MEMRKFVLLLGALLLQNVFCDGPKKEEKKPTKSAVIKEEPDVAPQGERTMDKEVRIQEQDPEIIKGKAQYPLSTHKQLEFYIDRHNMLDYQTDPTEFDWDPTEKPEVEIHDVSGGWENPAKAIAFQGVCERMAPAGFYDDRIPNMDWLRVCTGPYAADNVCQAPVEGQWMKCVEMEMPLSLHATEEDILVHEEMKKYFGAAKCGGELHGQSMPFPKFFMSWSTFKPPGKHQKKLICVTGASSGNRVMKKRCSTCQCQGCRGHCDHDLEFWISNVVPDTPIEFAKGGKPDEDISETIIPKRQTDTPLPDEIGPNYKALKKAVMERIERERVKSEIIADRRAADEAAKAANGEVEEELG